MLRAGFAWILRGGPAANPAFGTADVPVFGARSFSVAPVNVSSFSYRWFLGGNLLPDATNASVVISNNQVTISNLGSARENMAAANSRIRDVDVASETADMTRNNILMQAGISVLAQANQAPSVALNLLRG